jgi:hypothetical protein
MRKPLQQGEMDGLCGIYALVNAIGRLAGKKLSGEDATDLFRELIRSVYKRNNRKRKNKPRTPIEFIWDGTSTREISYMLKISKKFLNDRAIELDWKKPLQGRCRPNNINQYWRRLQETFKEYGGEGKCVAIVDYNWQINHHEEDGHWTCVTNVTEKTSFLHDSFIKRGNKFKQMHKSRCTLGHPTSGRPHRLFAHNVFLLRFNNTDSEV